MFEEPEAFLHPHQQETMFYSLRAIGGQIDQQVLITTHSPIFVSKASDDLTQIVRIQKVNGKSSIYQITAEKLADILNGTKLLISCFRQYIDDPSVPDGNKREARELISNPPTEDIQTQEELFNYQLWLDSDRSAMFFSDYVVLVEGQSDRVLFNYLLNNEWQDLRKHRVFILDTFGKFNIHRFMALLESFGIRHGVLVDGDEDRYHQRAVNTLILNCTNTCTIRKPYMLPKDIEAFLGLPKTESHRKPLEILKAVSGKIIDDSKIDKLREIFEKHLIGL